VVAEIKTRYINDGNIELNSRHLIISSADHLTGAISDFALTIPVFLNDPLPLELDGFHDYPAP
jgi:hypothetical protein